MINPYEPNIQFNRTHPLAFDSGWLMQGSGERVKEYANGHDGTIVGAERCAEGIDFNASLNKIQTVDAAKVLSLSEGSICFGYRQTNTPVTYYYFFCIADLYNIFSIYIRSGALRVYINTAYDDILTIEEVNAFIDGNYHNFVYSWRDSDNLRAVSIDGQLINASSAAFTSKDISGDDFVIGGRLTGTNRHCGGTMPYFYIYNRVLSYQEASQVHFNPYSMFSTPNYTTYYSIPTITFKPMIIGPY